MSQWGEEKQYGKARFVCQVDGAPFAPIADNQLVSEIVLIDDGGDRPAAEMALEILRQHSIGLEYYMWRSMLSNPDWTPPQNTTEIQP